MYLDNILKNGNKIDPKGPGRYGENDTMNDVGIKKSKDGKFVSIRFRNKTAGYFKSERVVPIIIANRIYFGEPKSVGGTGFLLSKVVNPNANSRGIRLANAEPFFPFVGEYETLKFDKECGLYYVEKPKAF